MIIDVLQPKPDYIIAKRFKLVDAAQASMRNRAIQDIMKEEDRNIFAALLKAADPADMQEQIEMSQAIYSSPVVVEWFPTGNLDDRCNDAGDYFEYMKIQFD